MPHTSVIGMYVYCKNCSKKFQLGSLNAREIELPMRKGMQPYELGWLCRCDNCGKKFTYHRADFNH